MTHMISPPDNVVPDSSIPVALSAPERDGTGTFADAGTPLTDPMAAVLESSRLVCSSLDLDEVLSLILRAAHDLSGAESVTVMLMDEAREWLNISAAIGVNSSVRKDVRLKIGEGLAGWVAQTGQPLHLSNPIADERYRQFPSSHISNILALPLRVRDRILGVLNLSQYHNEGLFSDTVVQMIEVFASHAAIAIDNAATATKLRRAAAREHLLNQINQAIREMHSADTVLNLALAGLGHTLELSRCALYRSSDASHATAFHLTNEWILPGEASNERWTTEAARTVKTLATVSCQFLSDDTQINTPICHQGRRFGWLQANTDGRARRWREDELDLVRVVGDQLALVIAQNELVAQEQRSRDLSSTLSQLAAACNAMISQESVLNFILEQLARFVAYDSAGVWLHHEDYYVILVAERGYRADVHNLILYVGPGSLNWQVFQQRRACVVLDVQQEPGWQNVPDSDIIRSWIGVPLLVNDGLIGMLTIDKWTPNAFSESDMQIAQAFADHVAVAIHNAQLYQQAQARACQLQALHRLSIRLSAMQDIASLLDDLARLIHETFGYYQVNVGLIEGENIVLKAACGQVNNVAHFGVFQRYPLSRGLTGWAARHGESLLANDVNQDSRYASHVALSATRAEIAVPIKGANQVLGIINIASNRLGAFTQDDIYLVEALAGQTAVALENIARYDELQRTQEELLRSERLRALGELASGVAHDFNNLLAGILGHAQLMLFDQVDPAMVEGLRVIERAAMDGAATVRRLQDFAQMHHSPPDEIVDVNQVIEECLAITRPRWRDAAQNCGIHFEIERELGGLPPIIGDAPALREVITNLLLNALDAMPQGGTLSVRTSVRNNAEPRMAGSGTASVVVIEISDTGVGMLEGIQKRVFDPFFTTKGVHGTGMGLAVVHGIIQRHNGSITVQSAPGSGSTFAIILPAGVSAPHHLSPAVAQADSVLTSTRVLVVEDEASVQQVLVRMLKRWGCRITAVSTGTEALEAFAPDRFDLVCTDLGMPGISGWDVLKQIREIDPQVATLLITGWGEQINPSEARSRGADLVLVKPFNATALYQAVKEVVSPCPRVRENDATAHVERTMVNTHDEQ